LFALIGAERFADISAIHAESRFGRNTVIWVHYELVNQSGQILDPLKSPIFVEQIDADALSVHEGFRGDAFMAITFHPTQTVALGSFLHCPTVYKNLSNETAAGINLPCRFHILTATNVVRLGPDLRLAVYNTLLEFLLGFAERRDFEAIDARLS